MTVVSLFPDPASVDDIVKRLENEFSDTLDKEVAAAGIYVEYIKGLGENQRVVRELGIPYFIIKKSGQQPTLLVGPYVELKETSRVSDYYNRSVSIPIDRIVNFRRIRLTEPGNIVDLRK